MLNFDVQPYYDDFLAADGADVNNYMRILFRPGFAVQARELTQIQSILQNQISTLGDFVFQDGSPVHGGHISLDTTVTALQLQQQFANVDINLSDFLVGGNPTLITNASGPNQITAYVIAIDSTQANPTILVKYLTATHFSDGATIQVATGVQTQASLITANSASPATTASINDGIFYSGGFFINVQPQTIVVDSTTNSPTYRIGLQIEESIIDESQDSNLLDPAQGSFNYQAPGATRYQYLLNLTTRTLASSDDSAFYELLRVENGLITKQIDYPIFADLDKALAERTYDTSGNFTVKPFSITLDVNSQNTAQYTIVVEPGRAYVKGFEFHTIGTQRLFVDKALQTNSVNTFGFSTDFGSLVTINNLYSGNNGFFDVANFANLDLHVCTTANINTTNITTYTATKIGTARIRDIEFLGLGQYYAYITDVNLSPNVFTAAAGSSNTITLPASYGQLAGNCYANVIAVVNTGGIIDTRTIISYANTTRIATLDRPLSTTANASSNVTLQYAIKDTDSLVVTPATASLGGNVYFQQNTTTPLYASMDISVGGRTAAGNTVLADTQFDKLLFALPQQYIAQNTIINATFNHRKNLYSQTFTSGNLTISSGSGLGTGESFPYGFTGSFLPDSVANNNFIVVVRNAQSSNLTNGQVIIWNRGTVAAGNGVFETDSSHVTIATSANNTFTGDILFTVQVTNAAQSAVARRTKTVVGNVSNTTLAATDSYLNGTVVIGSANAAHYIDTSNGQIWFTSNPDIPNTPGSRIGLGVADVFNVIKIYDSGSKTHMPNTLNAIDITNNYFLDSGQKDNYYNHSGLILKPGAVGPTGQTVVLLQYFAHDSVNGFFDADSYANSIYQAGSIPFYNSTKFGTFALRDCIDFRPTRTIGTTANVQVFNLTGLDLPQPDSSFQLSYQFYLPRVDKLQITKDKVFRVLEGTPSQYPQAPSDTDDAMTIYILSVPAFTSNVKEISVQYIENKRYTMRDIGALDKRIQQLEYYSALSQLEAQAVNEKLLYQDGVTAKDQFGVIADDFGSFSIADTGSRDLRCYLEPKSMGPYKLQTPFPFVFNSNTGAYAKQNKVYSLTYTETSAVQQNSATTFISVQPFLFAQFKGSLSLSPETDAYYSSNIVPQIIAPPTSPAVETPPLPPPPSQATIPTNGVTGARILLGDLEDIAGQPSFDRIDFWGVNGQMRFYYAARIPEGYGLVHNVDGWFGIPQAQIPTSSASTPPPSVGSPVQLNPGGTLTQGPQSQVNGTVPVIQGLGLNR